MKNEKKTLNLKFLKMGNQPASGFSITDQNGNDIANTVQDIDYLQCINITFDQNSRDTQFRVLIKQNPEIL